MMRKILGLLLATFILTTANPVAAQQPTKIPLIGRLGGFSDAVRIGAFRQGLRELSYVEGKNIVIEQRSHEGKFDRLPALAAELVRLKVAVIVTSGGVATRSEERRVGKECRL